MRKIGLLINPHAKKARVKKKLIQGVIDRFPSPHNIWTPKNLDELSVVTNKILEDGIEILFLSGGDGTFRATVESLLKHNSSVSLPVFVLLQGGTGGLYSMHYFGGKKSPLTHLNEILDQLKKDAALETTSINILKVNDHYGFIFAVGGFANVLEYYMGHHERSIALANWIIFKLGLSFVFQTHMYKKMFSRFEARIKPISGAEKNIRATNICCSALPVGYGMKPFYGMKLNETFSTMIFFKSPYRIFLHLPSILREEMVSSDNMELFTATSLEIFLPHPLQPMVDGDMLQKTDRIHVELGPEIRLLKL